MIVQAVIDLGNLEKENSWARVYWEKVASEFDEYYQQEKCISRRVLDKFFRKGMKERVDLTLLECKNVSGKKILDIGCGSGRIAIELAKRGAEVVGIDFSKNMLDMATLMAQKQGLAKNCKFILANFISHFFSENFDMSLALGFFDYTKDPMPYLKKMRSITREECIMTFPKKFAFQVPIRMVWLKSRKCPVYFYTRNQLERYFSKEFSRFKIKNISAQYFCVGFV